MRTEERGKMPATSPASLKMEDEDIGQVEERLCRTKAVIDTWGGVHPAS